MIEFTLFGIPIRILPWHWVGLAFISGAFGISSSSELIMVLMFMVAAFLSILTHELAHALVGRRVGGGTAAITMEMFGGLTSYYGTRFTKWGTVASVAAGPGINIATLLVCCIICFFIAGGNTFYTFRLALGLIVSPYSTFHFVSENFLITNETARPVFFMGSLMWTCFWWSLLNLLPIYPMDGGLILEQFLKSQKRLHIVGMVSAIIIAVLGFLFFKSILLLVFMSMFAYMNYQAYRQARY